MSNDSIHVNERMFLPTSDQEQEIGALKIAAELLIHRGVGRYYTAERYLETVAGSNSVELSQHVEVYTDREVAKNGAGTKHPTKPESDDALIDGSWFRKHTEVQEHSTLWVRPGIYEFIDNFKGSWVLPNRDSKKSDTSNMALLDPFENKVIPVDDPEYGEKWDKITGFMLDRLDEDGSVYFTEAWTSLLVPGLVRPTNLEKRLGYGLSQVLKIHPLKNSVDDFGDGETGLQLMFRAVDHTGESNGIYELGFSGGKVGVVDFHGDEDILPIQNPYDMDPELINKLTHLAIGSFEADTF